MCVYIYTHTHVCVCVCVQVVYRQRYDAVWSGNVSSRYAVRSVWNRAVSCTELNYAARTLHCPYTTPPVHYTVRTLHRPYTTLSVHYTVRTLHCRYTTPPVPYTVRTLHLPYTTLSVHYTARTLHCPNNIWWAVQSKSSCVCSLLCSPVTFCLLGPKFYLSTLS